MSYIEKNLINGENIIYRGKLHWVIFIWPAIWFIVAIMFFGGSAPAPIGGLFILIAIVTGIVSFINYTTSEFGITNKRIIVKVGFIRRNSFEVLLNKVQGIKVNQGILSRILEFGSITVIGVGDPMGPVYKISAPLEFRRKAQEQIASFQDSK